MGRGNALSVQHVLANQLPCTVPGVHKHTPRRRPGYVGAKILVVGRSAGQPGRTFHYGCLRAHPIEMDISILAGPAVAEVTWTLLESRLDAMNGGTEENNCVFFVLRQSK